MSEQSKTFGIRLNPKDYVTARDLIYYFEDNDLSLDTPLWPCVKLDGEEPRSGLCRLVYKFSLGGGNGVALTTEKPPESTPSKYVPTEYVNWYEVQEKLRAACEGAYLGWVRVGDKIEGYTLCKATYRMVPEPGQMKSEMHWLRDDGHQYRFTREGDNAWVCEVESP